MTLTIPVYDNIFVGFEMLTAARKAFERILRSDHRIAAYVVAAEVTRPPAGWHWHLHAAVFGNEFEVLADDLRSLWLEAAGSVGVPVSGCAQNAVVKSAEDALGYVVKGKLGGCSDSLMGLLRRAADGEVDAVDGWAELEVFAGRGHRWLHTYRMRDALPTVQKRTPVHSQIDVRLMILAELLGATSSRIQSRMVTTSGSTLSRPTISRIRRDDPLYRRWRHAPESVTRW